MIPFLERLAKGVMVSDGAMGTMIYNKGVYINRCFEALNVQQASLIQEVHAAYREAGAEILETNTYGANRLKLLPHGLESELPNIIRRGVELAREAAKDQAYVAGSIGPLGKGLAPFGKLTLKEARELFREQAEAMLDAGVDLIAIETIANLEEMKVALEAVKECGEIPVIAQMTLAEQSATAHGVAPEKLMLELTAAGADVVGLNCSIGPRETLDALIRMRKEADTPLCAQPNAGMPQLVEGRSIYLSTPEYMAEYARRMIRHAGVNILGGCCGTTPAHIRAIKSAVKMLQPGSDAQPVADLDAAPEAPISADFRPIPQAEKSPLAAKLAAGKFVVSIEIDPPHGANLEKVRQAARICAENEIDCVNIADGPRASARMCPMALAAIFQQELQIDPIVHVCCRDRNLIGLQSDLLGANAQGLRNTLIITGDPPKLGDYPDATAVFDVDSIGLVRIANRLNYGRDLAGKPIGDPTGLFIGVGADPGAVDFDEELRRLALKVKSGAEYILTQPVYDLELFTRFHQAAAPLGVPILLGILPLSSYHNAEFLHNEVPGMSIPEPILKRMREVGSGPQARDAGVAIASEALAECRDLVQGVYIMPPFNRVEAALEVLKRAGVK